MTSLMSSFREMFTLCAFDVLFVALLFLALVPLAIYNKAAFAVLKRNFVGYFSNPTGYVFLCLFVMLTSTTAFWTAEFFNSNLANFDQLNRYLPFIMLVFIPAITMSIWAEERRQGTDELLLTLPATDFDIVIGKYLASASIFTASLIFSQLCNYWVLVLLTQGDLDTGLLFATYLGYWLVGLAMLAIGMIASFLTSNLTVGFILGALFNVPLAFMVFADNIITKASWARAISYWSLSRQFEDFGRGVFSLSSITYFILLAAFGIYLSMVLIGRRHWTGGSDGQSLWLHYLGRVVALVLIVISANVLLANIGGRVDMTQGNVNTLSPDTVRIISELPEKTKHAVIIDSYIGAQIPEDYVKTRFELQSMLRELETRSQGRIKVRYHNDLEPFSKDAEQAESRYGIKPQQVRSRSQGVFKEEQVILGAAFTCGLEKVVVPFFESGIPVEYELVRSINTVAKGQRKKLGVVRTDAQMMGGADMSNPMQPTSSPKQKIIDELEKQYEVETVEPNTPIVIGTYDVLLVVQPSSLGPAELENVAAAIRQGQPTAIFEDPAPVTIGAPGTGAPKRQNPMAAMFGGGGPPPPKGDIKKVLWDMLGIKAIGKPGGIGGFDASIVWQEFNPYKKIKLFPDQFIFVRPDIPGAAEPINSKDKVTAGIDEILFPFPGAIEADPDSNVKFTTLIETGKSAGVISMDDMQLAREELGGLKMRQGKPKGKYTIAARIEGTPASSKSKDEKDGDDTDSPKKKDEAGKSLNVIYVADIDLFTSEFVRLREQPDQDLKWRFENVTFVLNVIDSLAGDNNYLDIRKRKIKYSTLKRIEDAIDEASDKERGQREQFENEFDKAKKQIEEASQAASKELQEQVNDLNDRKRRGETIDFGALEALSRALKIKLDNEAQKKQREIEKSKKDRDVKIQQIRRDGDLEIERLKRWFKLLALIVPPVPPLLIGLIVFVKRRLRESEGISKARLV